MNIAINGFGRIGRQALRIIAEKHPDVSVVLINDLTDPATLTHLYNFDSTYGAAHLQATTTEEGMIVGGKKIRITAIKDPTQLPHKELKVDVVLECTGVFTKRDDAAKHLAAGARKVIISAPCKDKADGTFCLGVNGNTYDGETMHVVSNASCTTNCLAPIAKVLSDAFGIERGMMTTVHSYTNDQNLLDLPHKDLRRARAAALSIVPSTTGAAKAIGLVVPEMAGKLSGTSLRIPTPAVSITDLTVITKKATTIEEVNAAFEAASLGSMKGILGIEPRPLVSRDFVGDSRSSIVDTAMTDVIGGTMVKVFSWYDNEWGYSNRIVELAKFIA